MLLLLGSSSSQAALRLEGEPQQGALLTAYTEPGSRVTLDGKKLRVSPEGLFLIGFGRDYPAKAHLEITHPDGSREKHTLRVAPRQYHIQRVDGLPKRKVTPKKADLDRIAREAKEVRMARARNDARTDFLTGWQWPVKGRISGVYGSQRVLNGEPRRPHFGVDIAAPKGTPVRAPADGLVTYANPDMFFSGTTLVLDHGHNLTSSFLHLNRILVQVGQRVHRGDVIAEVGASGRVTGPHLDWRMNYGDQRTDPQLLVPPMQP